MKTKDKKHSINRPLNKQFLRLFLIIIASFITLYAVLGIMVYTIVKIKSFSETTMKLRTVEAFNSTRVMKGPDGNSLEARINNPETYVIFYDEDKNIIDNGYSKELLNYVIENDVFGPNRFSEEEVSVALKNDIFKCNDNFGVVNSFEIVHNAKSDYYFMTLSFSVNSKDAPEVKYCKALIMVNAQINGLNRLMTVYIWSSLAVFIVILGLSILLAYLATKPIKKSIESEREFINDASHELKTPLAIVQSKLENILTKSDAKVIDVSNDLAISLSQVTRLNKLTSDLLSLARSDSNKESFEYSECNIKESLEDVVSVFKEMALIQEKEFNDELENITGVIDKDKINQLVIILLDNALKYTNSGESITIKLYKKQNDFCIEVSDTGIGITEETKKRIFDRFYREDKARSRETGGNGLGLSIAKEIVTNHHGKITVDHNLPKGTKFLSVFPIRSK